jgi:uncharacterized membrane protein
MKGEILNINGNEGIIIGEDGKRYPFSLQDWKEKELPVKGNTVDFTVEQNEAKEIYLIGKKQFNIGNGLIGGIGAILLFFTWIPYIGLILGIVGIFMLSIAIKRISDISPEKRIFKNWITAIILYVIGTLLLELFGSSLVLFSFMSAGNSYDSIGNLSLTVIVILIINYIMTIIEGILFKKAFWGIYDISGEKLFKTAGTLFFWGGILSIIFIGVLLFFVAWILIAIAFFSKKVK